MIMVDLAVDKPDILTTAEVKRRRVRATVPFRVAREKFSNWFQTTIAPEINWDDPMVTQMFHAWIAGSGITEWESDEDVAARERKKQLQAASREKMDRLRQEAEQRRRTS
jgi:hypothetical protein